MMRKYLLGGAIVVGVWTAALGSATASTHRCKSPGNAYGNIRVINTTCATADKVIRADTQGKRYDGWNCKSKRYTGGATVTCKHKGNRKITYQVAD